MPSCLYQNSIRIDVESISSPQANDTINKEFIDSMQKELRENKANLEVSTAKTKENFRI
jgi:hypothetical protein